MHNPEYTLIIAMLNALDYSDGVKEHLATQVLRHKDVVSAIDHYTKSISTKIKLEFDKAAEELKKDMLKYATEKFGDIKEFYEKQLLEVVEHIDGLWPQDGNSSMEELKAWVDKYHADRTN